MPRSRALLSISTASVSRCWAAFYRASVRLPPRELLLRALERIESEGRLRGKKTAIELGCGAGSDTLELLRRGRKVLAIDQQVSALVFLSRRVPPRKRGLRSLLDPPMEGILLPRTDLVHASFPSRSVPPLGSPRSGETSVRASSLEGVS
jgi:tellurite methyltransferase